jgi:hypothetical protein
VWGWGDNEAGQLGNGTNTASNVPVQVSGLSGITAIAGGGAHSLALKNDGTVWGWGSNGSGQLGDGTKTDRNVPVPVSFEPGTIVRAIAAGGSHSLAVAGCLSILVEPAALPMATMGVPYPPVAFSQTGGEEPVSWSLTGRLPAGMVFSGNTLSGRPAQTGSFPLIVTVTGADGCSGSRSYVLEVTGNFGLHFRDDYGRADLCLDRVAGTYRWTSGSRIFEGLCVAANGGTAFWSLPGDPVLLYVTYDPRRKRARGYLSDGSSGFYATLLDANTQDDGPCP